MADTTHRNQFLCFVYRIFEIFRTVHRQCRGQFFVSKRLAFINNFYFTDQDLSCFRNREACQFSNFIRRLTNDSSVQCAIFQDNVLNSFQLFALQHVAAVASETLTNCIVYRVNNNNGLFRSTDYAVIEGFRHQYRSNRALNIRSFVNNNRGVTCTYTDSWFTGAVCCFNHAWTAGRKDQVDVRVMHQSIRQFNGRLIDPADQIFRCTSSDSSLQNDVSRFVSGIFSTRMWREDDCVTRLQADQRFEDSSRCRVSGRHDTADDTNRFSDGDSTERVVFRQNTTGLFIFISVVNVFGSEVVFDHFVFDDAHAGFGNGHFRERDSSVCSCQCGGAEDFVNLFLSETGIFTLGFFYALYKCVKFSDISNSHNALLIMLNFFSKSSARYESIDRPTKNCITF